MIRTITEYNRAQKGATGKICGILGREIGKIMPKGTGRIYYSMPAWLIQDNPIVAYRAASKHVLVLFWSGQSFKTPGLLPSGSFKAAEIRYADSKEINLKQLRAWLKESKKTMWNYRDIRKNKGKLSLL
jgi:hypothetical protein